ncbi:hypothetical protein FGO68_gene4991 [Halteria grandinella]|uniref:Uncharacterized protein n=1 Tax=Halteria grandinella TaxID=5974 RepID=A0A8J8T8W5_HALGN|nr:hypothetical protein FGO68_gene4991 [Halteria grandinella]
MKMFAIDFLSDFLRQKIHCYQAYQIEKFANSVAYVIQRELRLQGFDRGLASTIIDGQLYPQERFRQGSEHIIEISIDISHHGTSPTAHIVDKVLWDLTNPENSPEEFARNYTKEKQLPKKYIALISLQIRRQIQQYFSSTVNTFKQGMRKSMRFNMPITQLSIATGSEEERNILPLKRKRDGSCENSDIEDLIEKVFLTINHQKYQPIKEQTQSEMPLEVNKILVSQIETSISDSTPLKNEIQPAEASSAIEEEKQNREEPARHSQQSFGQGEASVQFESPFTIVLQRNYLGQYSWPEEEKENDEIKQSLHSSQSEQEQEREYQPPHIRLKSKFRKRRFGVEEDDAPIGQFGFILTQVEDPPQENGKQEELNADAIMEDTHQELPLADQEKEEIELETKQFEVNEAIQSL